MYLYVPLCTFMYLFKKGRYGVIYMNTWLVFHVFMVRDGEKGCTFGSKNRMGTYLFLFFYKF